VDKLGEPVSGMAECSEQTRRVTVLYEAAVKRTEDLQMHEWMTWRRKRFIQLLHVL
jgi:ABC-type antimicrobial peptide transport system ATPase subunit